MSLRSAPLAGVLLAALALPAASDAQEPDDQGFEYHFRVGKLNLDYSRYEAAADALEVACRLPQGLENFDCYRLWATAAEKAYRIDDALFAWDSAEAVAEQGNTLARDEAARIRSIYGEVVLHAPWGRTLPSLPVELIFEGTLLDPEIKNYLERTTYRLATQGLAEKELFLPGGRYAIAELSFVAAPGERVELLLPEAVVPYRAAGVGSAAGTAVAGPGGLGLAFEPGAMVLLGGDLGARPVALGLQVRAGGRRGPLRIEARLRVGAIPVDSNDDGTSEGRSGSAAYVLGQGDVGLDIQVGAAWQLTPHVGGVGGTLGSLLVACQAEVGDARWVGECRLPTVAGGLQVGLDLSRTISTAGLSARVELRAGVRVDVLRGTVLASEGDAVGHAALHSAEGSSFTAVAPGGEVGVSVRF